VNYAEFDRHGSTIATEDQWAWAAEGFRTLADIATSLGFKLAFETHNCYLHDVPQAARRLIDSVGRESVGANLDFGNIILHPNACTLAEAFQILNGRIFYMHLKNFLLIPQRRYHQYVGCRLADGAINNRELLRLAKGQGYAGPVVIEAPAPGDREAFAKTDLAYIRGLLSELQ
jgi:sugar phosphate isomerase/epimerase